MAKEIRGLKSIPTLRKLKYQSSPTTSKQLELYLLENNMALLEKELVSMEKRKAKIEGKLKLLKEKRAELEGTKRRRKRSAKTTPPRTGQGPIQTIKIDY